MSGMRDLLKAHMAYATRKGNEPDYLTFTAVNGPATVALNRVGVFPIPIQLEYRIDSGEWIEYTWQNDSGYEIHLNSAGSRCSIRAMDSNKYICRNTGNYHRFAFTGKVRCTGNILSLLDKYCVVTDIPEYCFWALFFRADGLISVPVLDLSGNYTIGHNSFEQLTNRNNTVIGDVHIKLGSNQKYHMLFRAFSATIITEFVLDIEYTNENSPLSYLFEGNKTLNRIAYSADTWGTSTKDWMKEMLSRNGIFECSPFLPAIYDNSHIPPGWALRRIGYSNAPSFTVSSAGKFSAAYVPSEETTPEGYHIYKSADGTKSFYPVKQADETCIYIFTDGTDTLTCTTPIEYATPDTTYAKEYLTKGLEYSDGTTTYNVQFNFPYTACGTPMRRLYYA